MRNGMLTNLFQAAKFVAADRRKIFTKTPPVAARKGR